MEKSVGLLLRVGLAFVFGYASISAFLDPNAWIGFFPQFLKNIFPNQILLYSHSLAEIILAIWLLSGKWTKYAAAVSALALLSIIIFNLGSLDIIFRDIGLFFMALALYYEVGSDGV